MSLDPMVRKVLRLELADARQAFKAADAMHKGAATPAEKKQARERMKHAAAEIARIKAQLPAPKKRQNKGWF